MLLFAAWPQRPPPGAASSTRSAGRARCPSRRPHGGRRGARGCSAPREVWRRRLRLPALARPRRRAWERARARGARAARAGLSRLDGGGPGQTVIAASDHDPRAVTVARPASNTPGCTASSPSSQSELVELRAPAARGLVAANAPYGERLGRRDDAEAVSRACSARSCAPASAAGTPPCSSAARTRPRRSASAVKRDTTLRNGPLECTLAFYDVAEGGAATGAAGRERPRRGARRRKRPAARPRHRRCRAAGARWPGRRRPAPAGRHHSAAAPSSSPTACTRTCAA